MLCVLSRTVARRDCGSVFVIHVCLLSASKEVLDEWREKRVVEQWQGGPWVQVSPAHDRVSPFFFCHWLVWGSVDVPVLRWRLKMLNTKSSLIVKS